MGPRVNECKFFYAGELLLLVALSQPGTRLGMDDSLLVFQCVCVYVYSFVSSLYGTSV